VSRLNVFAALSLVSKLEKPSGNDKKWPLTRITKPTNETAKAPGENDIAIIGDNIVKSTRLTASAIDFCNDAATKNAAPTRLQTWTRQLPYPL
jgi:hypothetical protein